ncbi:7TM-DISM domain-containing protein [Persicitalea sp.]|uniref:sensor histidine kinase n=1 Tax=Persicitalea sp. TaxID=3100273 RepID=UPI003593B47D
MKTTHFILLLLINTHALFGQKVETLADSTRQKTVWQMKALYDQGHFEPLPTHRLLSNYTTANHWLHLRLPPGSRRLRYLEVENSRLNQVDYYQVVGDSLIEQVITGDSLPFSTRQFAHYQWVFPVLPDATRPTDVFVRVAKYGEVLTTNVRLWEPTAFENYGRTRYLLWGVLAGMTGLVLLLNGMVWLATADALYGWFMAIVVVSAFHLGAASGLFFQFLWPDFPIINDWYPQTLSAWLIVLFQVHFMQKFIGQTAQNSRVFRWVNAFKYCIIAATVLTILLLVLRAVPAFYFRVLLILTLFFSLMVVPLAVLSLRERLRQREPIVLFYMGITTMQFLILTLFFVNIGYGRTGHPLFNFTNEGLVLVNYLVDLILLSLGVLYFGFKRYRQQNEQLLTTLHQQEQAQSDRIIEALEMERSRMAEDLYDDVGAMLSTAIGYVSSVQRKPEVREKFPLLTEARRLLDRAVENLRTVSHNLMPKNFAELGLAQSLAETIDKVQVTTDIRFQYLVVGQERRLDASTEVQIFRIAAELINDILKNSHASEATLQLVFHDNHLVIIAEDNGPEPPEYTNLHSKVAFLNGKIDTDISSSGVTVVVEIPY